MHGEGHAVLKFFGALFDAKEDTGGTAMPATARPPETLAAAGAEPFDIARHLTRTNDLPLLDWDAARAWVDAIPEESERARAWGACERAWLEHLRAALGPAYHLRQQGSALLLSTLEARTADATLSYVNRTVKRIVQVLDGIAHVPEWGHHILIVFDDEDTYYRYVALYYPEGGEFARSSGMYLGDGCGHFVTVKADLHGIEPVIAHELTHACLDHLSIPAWLNEGIAVNTERRLCPPARPMLTPQQMHDRHRRFWGPAQIQQFWSGRSFLRADEGNELSYDLARIMVEQLAADWEPFRRFAHSADLADAGQAAAAEHLGLRLEAVVTALLEKPDSPDWAPNPAQWENAPERGAF